MIRQAAGAHDRFGSGVARIAIMPIAMSTHDRIGKRPAAELRR